MRRVRPALVADILTISRLGLAIVLVPAVWAAHFTLACCLLSVAWLTDILDGRVAQAAGVRGRLASWDLTVDTTVGACLIIGLTGAGEVPLWLAAVLILGLGAWFLTGNFAASLLLQLAGYLPLLGIAWSRRPTAWWLPFVTAASIGVIDWRRLLTVNIPRFIHSLGRGGVRPPTPADDTPM